MKPAIRTRSVMSFESPSGLSYIEHPPEDPVRFFTDLVKAIGKDIRFLTLNLATIDSEYGVLNRTLTYRGLTDDNHIIIVTERNSRKFLNIKENPKVAVTLFLGKLFLEDGPSVWQVRINGVAVELDNKEEIAKHWDSESVSTKIRSRICESGKPINHAELKKMHDQLLKSYQDGEDTLTQSATYTVIKVVANVWDFFKSEGSCVPDRVIYKKSGQTEAWTHYHVAA